jgi:hypothetical protein
MQRTRDRLAAHEVLPAAASAAGPEFQAQVAAFYAVAILCEELAPAPFDLAAGSTIEVRCEVEAAVDDTELALSGDQRVSIQAKHSVNASSSSKPPLWSGAAGGLVSRLGQATAYEWAEPLSRRCPT